MRNRFGTPSFGGRVVAPGCYGVGIESVAAEDQPFVPDPHRFHHLPQMAGSSDYMQDDNTRHVAVLENGFDIPVCVEIDIVAIGGGEEHGFGAEAGGGIAQLLPVERNAR